MSPPCGIEIDSRGSINGIEFTAEGSGSADPSRGLIEFGVAFHPTPPGADTFGALLSILIIPTAIFGRELDESFNLLTLANGSFQFRQDVAGEGVAARSFGEVKGGGRGSFNWSSRADGFVEMEGVSSVEPFDAVMIPQGAGKMIESLSIPILCSTGRRLVTIVRQFTFAPDADLPGLQLRRMILEPTIGIGSVSVKIQADIMPFNLARSRISVAGTSTP
ncbi:hypothetical protein PV721_26690 [Streptomyces sp. MB09-01]|uniref:hypothetical protein n=1 Tax=Streptomyces sp. MB09-01 TaxID=3028666 RepID=UPI0029BB0A5B|nr:hypothetical protein [Streptomyces sp. MB09-01]MDX3537881.1 hypothetical protein [Streptomyces sp. MB09-01]